MSLNKPLIRRTKSGYSFCIQQAQAELVFFSGSAIWARHKTTILVHAAKGDDHPFRTSRQCNPLTDSPNTKNTDCHERGLSGVAPYDMPGERLHCCYLIKRAKEFFVIAVSCLCIFYIRRSRNCARCRDSNRCCVISPFQRLFDICFSRTSKAFNNKLTMSHAGCAAVYTDALKVFLQALNTEVHRTLIHAGK